MTKRTVPIVTKRREATKELYKESRKAAVELYKKCMGVMIVFMTMCWALKKFVFFPLAEKIWNLALSTLPTKYITDQGMIMLLRYPYLLLILILMVVLFCVVTAWEMSGIMLCFAYYDQGEPVSLLKMLYLALTNMKHLAKPKNWLFFVFIMLILPVTDLYSAAGMLSALSFPEYIQEFIINSSMLSVGLLALYIFLLILSVRWAYVLQGVLIRRLDVKQARKESVELLEGRIKWQIWDMIRYSIERFVRILALPFAVSAIIIFVMLAITVHMSGVYLAYKACVVRFFWPLFKAAGGSFIRMAIMSYLVVNYRIFGKEKGIFDEEKLSEYAVKRKHIRSFKYLRVLIYAAIDLATVLLFACVILLAEYAPQNLELLRNDTTIAAHKGYSSQAPENTMEAFEIAYNSENVHMIELDIRESKDGIPIVIHNSTLKNACGVNRAVYDLTYEEIRSYCASYDFDNSKFPDAYVPTLEEVLQAYGGKITLLIEIKADSRTPDLPQKIIDLLNKYDCKESCMIHSGSYAALEKVKEIDSSIPCGYIIAIGSGAYYNLPAADFFSVEHNFVNSGMINKIHNAGKKVFAWTVDDESSIEDMLLLDADVIITDYPDVVYNKFFANGNLIDAILRNRSVAVDTAEAEAEREGEQKYENGEY